MESLVREALICVFAVLIYGLGLWSGYKLRDSKGERVPPPYSHEERIEKVKRTKPSLRNPMRTYDTRYDDFKTKRNLYAPVKPKNTAKALEDELEV